MMSVMMHTIIAIKAQSPERLYCQDISWTRKSCTLALRAADIGTDGRSTALARQLAQDGADLPGNGVL